MAPKGRPRLTEDQLRERITGYCARYGVEPNSAGLPPFPSGQRETAQHRDWIAVFKAHDRLARRQRGQCERCALPTSAGSVFCEAHGGSGQERAQDDTCPVCGRELGGTGPQASGRVHRPCAELARLARPLGPEGLERLARYLWPKGRRQPLP